MKPNIGKGDYGFTDFIGSAIAHKSCWQAEVCGTLDELNCFIAHALSHNTLTDIQTDLTQICQELFMAGTDVASSMMNAKKPHQITAQHVHNLEALIVKYESSLPVIKNFVLPLGPTDVSSLHQTRAVCRRTERLLVRSLLENKEDSFNTLVLAYLNRLSDVLFAMARWVLQKNNIAEVYWKGQ